ncbi:hypothetical protein [Azospirillum lipoferum]|uniref:hypothetical protein n=1 Tax=Azospirillum lipoferum TaxID=193 RepID=UPI0005CADFF8|nr:hypothetical protein [Azospirillum lipoferum]
MAMTRRWAPAVLGVILATLGPIEIAPIGMGPAGRAWAATAVPTIAQPVALGPLAITSSVDSDNRTATVVIQLQNQVVAAASLTASVPRYSFDVIVGTSSAKGMVTAAFMPPGQLSSVGADVVISTAGQPDQPFRGGLFYWSIPAEGP